MRRNDDGQEEQALAVTVALVLAVGVVVLVQCRAGPYVALVAGAGPVVLGYAARPAGPLRQAARAFAHRRTVRRSRRARADR